MEVGTRGEASILRENALCVERRERMRETEVGIGEV